MRNTVLYVMSCFLILSCSKTNKQDVTKFSTINNSQRGNLTVIDIDRHTEETVFLSKLFNTVNMVVLETTTESILGNISSIQIYNDSIFILDRISSKGVFLFNKEGKFLQRIGKIGQGPEEYIQPTDFTINKKDKLLYIIDSQVQKILTYDLRNCKCIKSINLKDNRYRSYHIQYTNGSLYSDVYYYQKTDSAFLLQEINLSTGDREKRWLQTSMYNKGFTDRYFKGQGLFYDRTQDSPKFIQLFMDTIISLHKNKLISEIAVKSRRFITKSALENIKGDVNTKFINLIGMDYMYNINSYVTYKNLILFNYNQKNEYRCCIYNTNSKETIIGNRIVDDLVFDVTKIQSPPTPIFSTSSTDGVYSFIQPKDMYYFLDLARSNKLSSKLNKIEKLKQLSVDSNPVLFIYK